MAPRRKSLVVECYPEVSLAGDLLLKITESPGKPTLGASGLVPVNRAGCGDPVVLLLAFLEGGLGGRDIFGLHGGEERIDMILDDSLAPAVASTATFILTNLLFPGLSIGHEPVSENCLGEGLARISEPSSISEPGPGIKHLPEGKEL